MRCGLLLLSDLSRINVFVLDDVWGVRVRHGQEPHAKRRTHSGSIQCVARALRVATGIV